MPIPAWVLLGLVSAVGAAGVAIFGKIGLGGVDPALATTGRSLVMSLALVLTCLVTGRLQGLFGGHAGVDRRAWAFILLAGAAGAISWLAYFAALRVGAAAKVASIDRLSLVFVMLLAGIALGERYGWRGWLGAVLVVLGVTLIAFDSTPVHTDDIGESPAAADPAS